MEGCFKGEMRQAKRHTEAGARHRKGRDPRVGWGVRELLQKRDRLIDVQIDDDSIHLLTEETLGRRADFPENGWPDLCPDEALTDGLDNRRVRRDYDRFEIGGIAHRAVAQNLQRF